MDIRCTITSCCSLVGMATDDFDSLARELALNRSPVFCILARCATLSLWPGAVFNKRRLMEGAVGLFARLLVSRLPLISAIRRPQELLLPPQTDGNQVEWPAKWKWPPIRAAICFRGASLCNCKSQFESEFGAAESLAGWPPRISVRLSLENPFKTQSARPDLTCVAKVANRASRTNKRVTDRLFSSLFALIWPEFAVESDFESFPSCESLSLKPATSLSESSAALEAKTLAISGNRVNEKTLRCLCLCVHLCLRRSPLRCLLAVGRFCSPSITVASSGVADALTQLNRDPAAACRFSARLGSQFAVRRRENAKYQISWVHASGCAMSGLRLASGWRRRQLGDSDR